MDQLQRLLDHSLSRRDALKASALAGFAGFLAACTGSSSSPSAATSAPEATASGAPAVSPSASAAGGLQPMDGLVFQPFASDLDVSKKALDIYKQQYGVSVEAITIPTDYYATTATRLASGNPPMDSFFQDAGFLAQYVENKWVVDLEGLPGMDEMKGDMLPSALKAVTGADGKIYALPMRINIITMMYNKEILDGNGMKPAADWDELYQQAVDLKKAGVESPIIPVWTTKFALTKHIFVMESISRGMTVQFDDQLNPLWDTDPVAKEVLDFWRRIQDANLVPPDALTVDHHGASAIMQAGKGAYFAFNSYEQKILNTPGNSAIAGKAHTALMPGKQHATSTFSGYTYQTTRNPRDKAWPLTSFAGGRDKNGAYTGPIQITGIGVGQLTGYKTANDDPSIAKAWSDWASPDDLKVLSDQAANAYAEGDVITQTWYSDYNDYMASQLSRYLAREIDADTCLKDTADHVRKLKAG